MGVWAEGLYSGDFAMDLRAAIGAVARLPFEGDRLLEILCETESGAANNPKNEDHSIFWVVVADQFAKRGIACKRLQEVALAIINGGTDLEVHKMLGMPGSSLARRQKMLLALRERITEPAATAKPRTTLKKPQPLLMNLGDVLVYPTSRGQCINSYFASKEKFRGWQQDGWSAALVVDHGRAFDFLAWYRPLTITTAIATKPIPGGLRSITPWVLRRPGTCSDVHFKRMELQKIARTRLKADKIVELFGNLKPGTYQAINDISIVNELSVGPERLKWLQPGANKALYERERSQHIIISDLNAIADDFEPLEATVGNVDK